MSKSENNYQVQFSGEYHVAQELTKRGYIAMIVHGHAPETDILARVPTGKSFSVEVKSMRKPNFWRFRKPAQNTDYWFFVVTDGSEPVVSIMKGEEVLKEWQDYFKKSCEKNLECIAKYPETSSFWGIPQGVVTGNIGRWDILPKA